MFRTYQNLDTAKLFYWIGCVTTYRLPHIAKAVVEAFRKMQVKPMLLDADKGCCGDILLLIGRFKEFKENAEKVVKIIEGARTEVLVTECAGCYRAFTEGLASAGINRHFQVMHTSQFVENMIRSQGVKFKELNMKVTYHDPCELGRHCNVYDSPRKVLKAIPGLQLLEMEDSKSLARCCGAGGGGFGIFTRLAQQIGRKRIVEDVLPTGANTLVTACPACYMNFSYIIRREKMPLKLYDIMETVNMAL